MKLGIKTNSNIERMMNQLGDDIRGGLIAGTTNVLETIAAKAAPNIPVATSNLVNSETIEVSPDGKTGALRYTAEYGRYVHDGTGLYGPHKQKIVPKNKQALYGPGMRHPVKSIKGIRPNPFVTNAVKATDPQQAFEDGMENYLKKKGHVK